MRGAGWALGLLVTACAASEAVAQPTREDRREQTIALLEARWRPIHVEFCVGGTAPPVAGGTKGR